jgi:hypothetical protein
LNLGSQPLLLNLIATTLFFKALEISHRLCHILGL